MKITQIDTFLVDAGWRPWAFVKVSTSEGVVGYGEASCFFTQHAVLGAIEDMKSILIGADPRAFETRFWEMYRASRLGSIGGAVGKAIGALECAMVDIAARANGQSVAEYFGGPLRHEVPLYWSHCITNRINGRQYIGSTPIRSMDDVAQAAALVKQRGFKALKTNILVPGDPGTVDWTGYGGGPGTTDQVVTPDTIKKTVKLFETLREAVGPDIELILDLNFNCKPEGAARLAKALEPFNLAWLEVDYTNPQALRQLREAISTPLCSSETMFYMEQHLPFLEARCLDIVMIDVPWNGFAQAKKIGDLAQVFSLNICPHNYYSHLSSFISANLAAVLPNVRIMEYDVDDIPWKDEFVTRTPVIENGAMKIPSGPGWGTELNEEALRARRWGGNARTAVSVLAGGMQFDGFNDTIVTQYARGRSIDEIRAYIAETHDVDVTPEFIRWVTEQVTQHAESWRARRLEATYPVVYLDDLALQFKDASGVHVKNAYIAVGVRPDGGKDVLGLWITDVENEEHWLKVLAELKDRGVRDILLLCTDSRVGLTEALAKTFTKPVFVTRIVQMMRSSVSFVPLKERRTVFDDLRDVYVAPSLRAAEEQFEHFVETWGSRFPIIPAFWQSRWDEVTKLLELPSELRTAISATKLTEPLNRQIRKVVSGHGYFSEDRLAFKLIYLAIREATQEWGGKDVGWGPALQASARHFNGRMNAAVARR